MPVLRRPAPPVSSVKLAKPTDDCRDKTPFASVAEAAVYLKESKRTIRELVNRGMFKLAPNSNGKEKPWRLLWSEIKRHAEEQGRRAVA